MFAKLLYKVMQKLLSFNFLESMTVFVAIVMQRKHKCASIFVHNLLHDT